jgi:hypothetical protein
MARRTLKGTVMVPVRELRKIYRAGRDGSPIRLDFLKTRGNPTRFERCVADVTASGTADDPNAVCASAGRKKYGKAKFQKMAAKGRRKARRRR